MVLMNCQTLADLKATFAAPGRVEWIGLRTKARGIVKSVRNVTVVVNKGLVGDHRALRGSGKRQITLMQLEHLAVAASLCGKDSVNPEQLRRNLLVSGINLIALRDKEFHIGDVLLRGTGHCHPCSRMEENLGLGGYNAMRGHGGITAIVLLGGDIHVGDSVSLVEA